MLEKYINIITFNKLRSAVIIDYIPKNLLLENNAYKEIDAGRAGQGRINLATGDLKFTHLDASIRSGSLSVGLSHIYDPFMDRTHTISENRLTAGFGKNWKLNMQQYLIRESIPAIDADKISKIFTFLDGKGNKHIFKEKYYYLDNNKVKHYLNYSEVNIDENENLYFVGNRKYKVEKELVTSSGMTLVTQLEGFKGIKYIQTEIDEIVQVKENIKQLNGNIDDLKYNIAINKQKICLFALSKKSLDIQNQIQKLSSKDSKKRANLEKELYDAQQAIKKLEKYGEFINLIKNTDDTNSNNNDSTIKDAINKDAFDTVYNRVGDIIKNPDINVKISTADDFQCGNNPEEDPNTIYLDINSESEGTLLSSTSIKSSAVSMYIQNEQDKATWGVSENANPDEPVTDSLKDYQNQLSVKSDELTNKCSQSKLEQLIRESLDLSVADANYLFEDLGYKLFFETNDLHTNMSLSEIQISQLDLDINQVYRDCKSCEKLIHEYEDEVVKSKNELKKLQRRVPVHYISNEEGTTFGFSRLDTEVNDNYFAIQNRIDLPNKTDMFLNNENTDYPIGEVYRLVMIADKWENAIYFEFNDENQIERIVGDKNELGLKYDSNNGMLISITDGRGRETQYVYDTNERLTKVIYNDETESTYTYDDELLKEMVAPNGLGIQLSYSNNRINSVAEIAKQRKIRHNSKKNFTGLVKKSEINIAYNDCRRTTITEENGKEIVYLFDNDCRPITIYEKKNGLDGCLAKSFDYSNGKIAYSSTPKIYGEDYLQNTCFINRNGDSVCEHEIVAENYLGNNFNMGDVDGIDGETLSSFEAESSNTVIINPTDERIGKNVDVTKIINSGKKDFVLSAWAMADSAYARRRCTCFGDRIGSDETYDELEKEFLQFADSTQRGRRFEIGAVITYRDTKNNVSVTDNVYASFDWQQQDWQYCSVPIVLSENKSYILESLFVYMDYSLNTNFAQIKNMQLKEGEWNYSEYNSDGAKTYEENSKSKYFTEYEYDDDKKLVKVILRRDDSSKEYITTYDYNAIGALIRTVDYNGIVNETEYNDKGIVLKNITYNQDEPSSKYYEESILDDKGTEIGAVNEFGEKVCDYTNIPNTDIVSVSTDKNGEQVAYGYDHNDDTLLSVSASVDGQQNANVMEYTLGLLTKLSHNGTEIEYAYDNYGDVTEVAVAEKPYMRKQISNDKVNKRIVTTKRYMKANSSNGSYYDYESIADLNGKISEINYQQFERGTSSGKATILRYGYDTSDRLIMTNDLTTNIKQMIDYDAQGNECKREYLNRDERILAVENNYDSQGNILESKLNIGSHTRLTAYSYENTPDRRLSRINLPNGIEQTPIYDKLGRMSGIDQKKGASSFGKDIFYKQVGDHTSELVASEWFEKNGKRKERLSYSYDEKGNIIAIKANNVTIVRYAYDSLSRIVREDNKNLDKTTIFEYDNGGNILSRTEYSYTLKDTENLENGNTFYYEYASKGWRDQLLSYNGQICGRYDNLGNPGIYRGKTLSWSHGRQLDSIGSVSYKYNAQGIRISKTINGVETKFFVDGTTIVAQECGNDTVLFTRGIDGLNGFNLNGTEFYYKKNIQGDVLAIMDNTGAEIVQYVYDAWGNHKTLVLENGAYTATPTTEISQAYLRIANFNPYRYRSYYYDVETGLYYLNTRYYDSEVGRFINADDVSNVEAEEINGLNLYAYCLDNPVMLTDDNGNVPKWLKWLGVAALAVLSVALIATGVGAAFAAAATTVAATATTLTVVASVSVGMGIGGIVGIGTSIEEQGGFSTADPGRVLESGGSAMIAGGIIGLFSGIMSLSGQAMGSLFGFNLGNMTHIASGVKVGKIISTTTLMKSFGFAGGIAGGLLGSTLGNYIVNIATGNSYSPDEYTKKSAEDELPMWIVNILRWLFG